MLRSLVIFLMAHSFRKDMTMVVVSPEHLMIIMKEPISRFSNHRAFAQAVHSFLNLLILKAKLSGHFLRKAFPDHLC